MPQYLRQKLNGATYFFTVVTYRRRRLFEHPAHRRMLGTAFRAGRANMPFEIDAIVLLPDHLHVLLRPQSDVNYSALWRLIKTEFTRQLHRSNEELATRSGRRRAGEADVWQRRFYEHTIRDEKDWGQHVDYIHFNPVKHSLVQRPQDWRWSSVHRFVRLGWLEDGWPGVKKPVFPNVPE